MSVSARGFNIGLDSTDEELNARMKPFSGTWYHPGGTAAMGSVVDSECRVDGVQGLRVVDASILPKPLGAHYQGTKLWPLRKMKLMSRNLAPIYAIAEQASDMIASAHS